MERIKKPDPKSTIAGPGTHPQRCAIITPIGAIRAPAAVLVSMYCLRLNVVFLAMEAGMIVRAPISSVPASLIPSETITAKIKRRIRSELRRTFGVASSGATVAKAKLCAATKVEAMRTAAAIDTAISSVNETVANPPKSDSMISISGIVRIPTARLVVNNRPTNVSGFK